MHLWVPFFSAVTFVAGTVINTKAKRAQLAIAKAKRDAEKSEKRA